MYVIESRTELAMYSVLNEFVKQSITNRSVHGDGVYVKTTEAVIHKASNIVATY